MVATGDGAFNRIKKHWRWLPVLATIAVAVDAVTTAAVIAAGVAREQNSLLVAGLEYGLSGGALVFVLTQGLLLAVAWLSLGAVSTYVAVYLIITMGLGGGLSNAILVLTGESMLAPLGASTAYLGPAGVATLVGIGAVRRRHNEPSWGLVIAVAGALLVGEIISLVG